MRHPLRIAALSVVCALSAPAPAPAAVADTPNGFFGVSPAAAYGLDLDRMQQAGIHELRFPFYWPILQPQARGGRPMSQALAIEKIDPFLLEAARRGIRVLPYVYGTPPYLAPKFTTPPIGTKNLRHEWSLLLKALDNRYGRSGTLWKQHPKIHAKPITAFQIWNEPSSASFWHPVSKSPEGYAKLLEISSRALRAGPGKDPTVVAAGLFVSPSHGIDMPTFLQRFYAIRGVSNRFDALAVHPYAPSFAGTRTQISIARSIMGAAGDARKPLWVTEIGWPTGGSPNNPFYKTFGQQAKLLKKTFSTLLEKRRQWRIRHVIWYTWRDNNINQACDLCQFSGLFDIDGNPKPAWPAFVHFTGGTP